ncbi:type II toxin-antitoxin system Phd/YefM family antitoxin [Pectobacterium actinidiae]|uniref:type II toxin-antitoxin system Phd/YefM family antitoxin n=1 Tax=Pectobacterium actinidiae TaxID=1507808 RepID=UPI004040B390
MKTITYTQMRSDLSTTLELLRSGESVTVTQRGKPDLVISARDCDEKPAPTIRDMTHYERKITYAEMLSEKVNEMPSKHLEQLISANLPPQFTEGVMKLAKQLDNLRQSNEAIKALTGAANIAIGLQGASEQFVKALQHTQTRHADIIKKLEDK